MAWFVGLELMKAYRGWWWLITALLFLHLFFAVWLVCNLKVNKTFFNFLILPIIFGLAGWSFVIFLISDWFSHFIIILMAVLLYMLINQFYLYFNVPNKYQPYSLETLSLYMSLLASFFLYVAAFGAVVLLQFNKLGLIMGLSVIMIFLLYQFFWLSKFDLKKNWMFVLVITMLLGQLFWAITFLPTGYYVNGFAIVLALYLMLGFSKHYLLDNLNRKRILSYLFVGAACLLIVFATAQWT